MIIDPVNFLQDAAIGIVIAWVIHLQRQVNQCRRIIQQRTNATADIALRAHDRIDGLIPRRAETENA